eukprot:scaffold42652_cov42-Phaeocystis_antarctica.AAC.1
MDCGEGGQSIRGRNSGTAGLCPRGVFGCVRGRYMTTPTPEIYGSCLRDPRVILDDGGEEGQRRGGARAGSSSRGPPSRGALLTTHLLTESGSCSSSCVRPSGDLVRVRVTVRVRVGLRVRVGVRVRVTVRVRVRVGLEAVGRHERAREELAGLLVRGLSHLVRVRVRVRVEVRVRVGVGVGVRVRVRVRVGVRVRVRAG